MIRSNDTMYRAGQKELQLLRELRQKDPNDRKHIVALLDTFEYRNHLCIVFEALNSNLREVLNKYGKNIGINIDGVRRFTKQLFIALYYLKFLKIVHADLKLDNILVSENLKKLKVCDFGSAFKEDDPENAPTPYLVSRFYRAPEIMLGLKYNCAIDVWAAATCIYEIAVGSVLYPGKFLSFFLCIVL